MKRSEINTILNDAKSFIRSMHFYLPRWAEWSPDDWKKAGPECKEIIENQLGWDITDFGSGDFGKTGLFLFTDLLERSEPVNFRHVHIHENR